ncbi:unnamed protein product [Ilex paraguariensis]|uniref:Uncharacterized protein n=1 Tax=Ilex paraguariensis TaxID=185542 RepID=A0ABC8RRR9_9AQUA
MQQSAAFKILWTRLKTVPSYSFNSEQFKRTSSWNPNLNYMQGGSQNFEGGDMNEDSHNVHNGINFTSRLQQFELIQQQHQNHSKSKLQSSYSSTSSTEEVQRPEEPRQPLLVPEMTRPSSRSFQRGTGQLQL